MAPGPVVLHPCFNQIDILKGRERKRDPEVTVKLLYYGLENHSFKFNQDKEDKAFVYECVCVFVCVCVCVNVVPSAPVVPAAPCRRHPML